jgi:hypothetical protein
MLNPRCFLITALPLLLLSGCPSTNAAKDVDGGAGDAAPKDSSTIAVTVPRGPIGTICSTSSDCTSGFCTDGVCCDSACNQTCFSCNAAGKVGNCAPLTSGQDLVATAPCAGSSTCKVDVATSLPECKVADLHNCKTNSDCSSNNCVTFFVDADGDGYGTPTEAQICTELGAQPPPGYAVLTGDCCDIDSGANPGVPSTAYFGFADQCGSFDWNCDGKTEQQQQCTYNASLACGAECTTTNIFGGGIINIFTEACH